MRVSFNWLKEFVETDRSPTELAERLTMAGMEVESVEAIESDGAPDWALDVAVPPNRGDCLSVIGLAREIAAITGAKTRRELPKGGRKTARARSSVQVEIVEPALCPRYSALIVRDLSVEPPPAWMRRRLETSGIRSINNIVDVTNLVMLETGQPLHAFDWDTLTAKRIVVRTARARQPFTTLDGVTRELEGEDLLICDGERPIALAGVMGGSETEVSERTRHVLLESAHFDPLSVRRTAKRLGLHSEASYRFERFVDPEGTVRALERAAALLSEVAGGKAEPGVADCRPGRRPPQVITLRDSRLESLAGAKIEREKTERLLRALGLKIVGRSKGALKLIAPSYRNDLTREADLIEEVIRLAGYGEIPAELPLARHQAKRDRRLEWERQVRSLLLGKGLTQAVNLVFTSATMNRKFPGLWRGTPAPVAVLNPLSQEHAELRLSLLAPLAANLRAHVDQRAAGVSLFEIGKSFSRRCDEKPEERLCLSGLCYGEKLIRGLRRAEPPWSFLDVKGVVEEILELLRLEQEITWSEDQIDSFLHPGKAASLVRGGRKLGLVGEIHPEMAEDLQLPRFFVFELDFEAMLEYARRDFTVHSLPRFPAVERDVALVVKDTFRADQIVQWVRANRQPLIEDVRVFDEYRGAQVGEGMKSLAYKISYRADNRTLTDAEVNEVHQRLVQSLIENFAVRVRQ
ncbi:MAG TPA: phenylalanine--tRNA ligase subunit beta [Candidatus Acidoferrales bacterium]|nr:phenylalanine--tRNA ligase subunit beta [Candidatus Acidoferrales bacterium]